VKLLKVVAEDIEYLRSDWLSEITNPALRQGSTTLRRLLVDGDLQTAWKKARLPGEPQMPAFVIPDVEAVYKKERIVFASAGGAIYRGAQVAGMCMVDYEASNEELKRQQALGIPRQVLGLRRFTEGPCIRLRRGHINRRQLVKYVANKLGGAHYDERRGSHHEESLYRELDALSERIQCLGKPVLYFELLSIGQALANAPDLHRLVAEAKKQRGR
jgi:hypothetical protein